ncbi:hypothetical protein CL629_01115 [bacterium]|nr:hypothetical protein [bacterium]|tara:strand:+ start:472 stop:966 length:495 start_codon:yes stop_codon:yes gene_type:complete
MGKELEKKFVWIGVLLFVLGGAWFLFRPYSNVPESGLETLVSVSVGENVFEAEVADSIEERSRGLSGREGLEDGRGMLFLFEYPAVQGFWMKDMKFPIDIIWVLDGEVIGFEENVPMPLFDISESELPVYFSPEEVDMVLEIGAHEVERLGIEVGDLVDIKDPS